LSSFWFVIKRKLTTKEIYIFSNSSHFEWRAGLSDKHPHFLSTLDVKLKTRWAITGSWEPLVQLYYDKNKLNSMKWWCIPLCTRLHKHIVRDNYSCGQVNFWYALFRGKLQENPRTLNMSTCRLNVSVQWASTIKIQLSVYKEECIIISLNLTCSWQLSTEKCIPKIDLPTTVIISYNMLMH
jgi:hypothetical protein